MVPAREPGVARKEGACVRAAGDTYLRLGRACARRGYLPSIGACVRAEGQMAAAVVRTVAAAEAHALYLTAEVRFHIIRNARI